MCHFTRAARRPQLLAAIAVLCSLPGTWVSSTLAQAPVTTTATTPDPAAPPTEAAPAPTDLGPRVSPPPQAQSHADDLRSGRLDSALRDFGRVSSAMRTWGGVSELVLAGTSATLGVLVATDDDGRWGKSRASAALAGTLFAIGGSLIASAITHWIGVSSAERRLQRWDALSAAEQHEPAQIAHYEGELQSEADGGAERRLERLPMGIGFVAGGGALVGFGASSAFEHGARTTAYTLGACYAGVGVLQIATALLSESLGEKIWHRYAASSDQGSTSLRLNPL